MLKRGLSVILLVSLITAIAACSSAKNDSADSSAPASGSGGGSSSQAASDQPSDAPKDVIEYTIYNDNFRTLKLAPEATDVVTPYVEQKFGLKVKQFLPLTDQPFKERLNAWIATDSIPDVLVLGKETADYAVATGEFADLTDYVADMPNLAKWFPDQFWPRFENDGKKYQLPIVTTGMNPELDSDPYYSGIPNWAIWVREDLLAQAGYTFKKLKDIKAETADQGKKPAAEDFAIDPPINTPDDFYNLLKKIQALNVKASGRSLIPFSSSSWSQFHLGTMFQFGHWELNDDGSVDGWLGSKEAKDYYQFLNRMYNDGLLDKDFIIQKDDQLQSKIASGQVASGIYIPDVKAARSNLQSMNPDAEIRYIPWPKKTQGKGFYDIYEGAYWRLIVKKDFKDMKRLMEFYDWSLSDEGLETLTWGPESAGLWEMKDGKKLFKDPAVEADMLSGTLGGKGSDYYGLYTINNQEPVFYSKAGASGLSWGNKYNPKSFIRSYPPKPDVYFLNQAYASAAGLDTEGKASYGDGTDLTNNVNGHYWSKFEALDVAKVLVPKPDKFDSVWDPYVNAYKKEVKYEEARAAMAKWFQANSGR
ncbi:hypothetical protein [Cohnella caldifontis]|uniref:hypothetical protein n=1 Tax=Cohnella caldifontis TaxID=3027471 RepID=UPI0023ED115D|nr:hypothetical protein [Cohnella sp. YIM B05605]